MSNKSRQGFVRLHTYRRLEKHCEYLELVIQAEKKKVEILKLVRPKPLWGRIKCFFGRHDLKLYLKLDGDFEARKVCKQCGDTFVKQIKTSSEDRWSEKWVKVEKAERVAEKNAKEKH